MAVATTTTRHSTAASAATLAWLITALYFFYQYALRSAPAVMMPQLSEAFGVPAAAMASLLSLFYYGYSPFSLVAGAAIDRFGPKRVIPVGAAAVGAGALLFATGASGLAGLGRFLQGAGGAVAFVGAVSIISTGFAVERAATMIGATQMFGMAGGAAGQFVVGPVIAAGVSWHVFWVVMGVCGLAMGVVLFLLLPRPADAAKGDWLGAAFRALVVVFRNPQSLLCGAIAGLLFVPTTILDMTFGVRYLQDARGFDYGTAVLRSSLVPLGWIVGCPLLGWVSDRLGRRKPVLLGGTIVLLGCLAWILYGPTDVLPPYVLGLVAGIVSGAAVLTTSVAKEANPPQFAGTATGVVNFLNFTFSALLGPFFGRRLMEVAGGATTPGLEHYQSAFLPMLYGVALAGVLILVLKETGPAARR